MDISTMESKQLWLECYKEYKRKVETCLSRLQNIPSTFSLGQEELFYLQCIDVPLPPLHMFPKITLPLRINLVRSNILGCNVSQIVTDEVTGRINELYSQAGIVWDPIFQEERNLDDLIPESKQKELRNIILDKIGRNSNQKRGTRRKVFLQQILSLFNYQTTQDMYDIWLFDIIGNTSQGCCIDRLSRTIIMGERSNKGYRDYTIRKAFNLATTMAHELGHALKLGHPRNRAFSDGRPHNLSGRPNVMSGGIDARGGGGDHLEDWQICMVRSAAEEYLAYIQSDNSG